MRTIILFAPILVTLVGCSSSSSDGAPGGSSGFDHDLVVSMELTVKSGQELHQCQLVTLPADADVDVVSISHEYTTGSHHFIVYSTDFDSIPPNMAGQYDCVRGDEPIMLHTQGILYAAQTPKDTFAMPAGVGLPLKAHQVLLLQAHYINSTASDVSAKITAGFDTGPAASIREKAGFLLFYDPFIYLPAMSSATSGVRCQVPEKVSLITAFSHYHQRGTAMRAWNDPSMTARASNTFYQSDDWEHPDSLRGPFELPKDSVVRFECDYTNSDPVEVFQGPNAKTSEMCVFFGLYYPKQSSDFEFCSNLSVNDSGGQACKDVLACIQTCPAADAPVFTNGGVLVGECWERCVDKSCPGATDAVLPVSLCASQQCGTACETSPATCESCVLSKCTTEVTACLGQTCAP